MPRRYEVDPQGPFIFADSDFSVLTPFKQTDAEIAAGVTPTNYAYAPGHVLRYGTNTTPGTTDMTTAFAATVSQAKQTGGAVIQWPAGTYLVSKITLDGSGYTILTGGGRSTILKQTTGTNVNTGQIINVTGANINIGDLAFTGNIATDTSEFHHCVYCFDDALAATIKNIHLGDLYGTDIRGDVLYVGGLLATPTTGITFGTVSGTNVFRNLLSVVGGEVTGDAVIHDGPVGYRDFDVEPNAGGTYQPGDLKLRYCKAGIIQTASGDTALENTSVCIDVCDMDFNRIAATTPGYPSAPGVNGQALNISNVKFLKIGYLKCRNYNYAPVTFGQVALKCNAYIDYADFSNCTVTETTYKALFADLGTGGCAYLEIGNLVATLFSTAKRVFTGNGMVVRVRRGTVSGGMLAATVTGGIYENMTIDMNSGAQILLDTCPNSLLNNVAVTNAGSATLLSASANCELVNVTGTFATTITSTSLDIHVVNSTLNSVKYYNETIGSGAPNKAGTATFSAATTVTVTFATAEGNASYKVVLAPQADPVGRLWVSTKATGSFVINNSSSTSIAVDWFLYRIA